MGWYQQWLSGERRFRPDWALRTFRQGAMPMVTWEPWSAPQGEIHTALQPDISLQRIVDGAHDAYIRTYARTVAAYGQPVLLRLAHEMNGNWYPWGVFTNGNTPELYVQAWRHVHRIFDAAGADNVSWIWSINNLEGRPGENNDLDEYYPGSRWVDWSRPAGSTGARPTAGARGGTADSLFGATHQALSAFGKPIMISEIGTTDSGGDPYSWIGQTLETLRTGYPLLRAVVFYDDIDGGGLDFRLRGPTARAIPQPGALGTTIGSAAEPAGARLAVQGRLGSGTLLRVAQSEARIETPRITTTAPRSSRSAARRMSLVSIFSPTTPSTTARP